MLTSEKNVQPNKRLVLFTARDAATNRRSVARAVPEWRDCRKWDEDLLAQPPPRLICSPPGFLLSKRHRRLGSRQKMGLNCQNCYRAHVPIFSPAPETSTIIALSPPYVERFSWPLATVNSLAVQNIRHYQAQKAVRDSEYDNIDVKTAEMKQVFC